MNCLQLLFVFHFSHSDFFSHVVQVSQLLSQAVFLFEDILFELALSSSVEVAFLVEAFSCVVDHAAELHPLPEEVACQRRVELFFIGDNRVVVEDKRGSVLFCGGCRACHHCVAPSQ